MSDSETKSPSHSSFATFLKKNGANILSVLRVLLGLSLFAFLDPKYNIVYLVIYSLAWLTDAFDGKLARWSKSESAFGSRLDDIGDIVLVIVLMISIGFWLKFAHASAILMIPYLSVFFAIRIFNLVFTVIKYKKVCLCHLYSAKGVGILVFLLPIVYLLTENIDALLISVHIVMNLSFVISLEETAIHVLSKEFNLKCKTVFWVKRFNAEYDKRIEAEKAQALQVDESMKANAVEVDAEPLK
ncbi:MAG: CDP-alcohol phosphatidyltransferase family protein [Clostridiales bacterium]|jgi:CDP-diacylglycerol--glycerol-3-phosphate 3-phosphatidyltransferase|nr:CDP-alcohol phosphatidyltransferase family protein [Clostridiales bacterium]